MALLTVIKGNHLAGGLSKVLKAKASNTVLPILENVYAQTVPKGAVFTCTNLDTTVVTGIAGTTAEANRTFLIPPGAYQTLLEIKDERPISISEEAGVLTFAIGEGNYIRVAADDAANFPALPTFEPTHDFTFPIAGEQVKHALEIAGKFTGNDELRANLTGVNFTPTKLTGTDGHRLIQISISSGYDKEASILISKGLIAALPALDGKSNPRWQFNDQFISVNDKATKITARLINAQTPKYASAIPEYRGLAASVDRKELLTNISLAYSITQKSDNRLSLFFGQSGQYMITGTDKDLVNEIKLTGSYEWVKNEGLQSTFEIHVNGRFLSQALDLVGAEKATLQFTGAEKPIVIEDEDCLFLVIPLRQTNKS